MFEDSQESAVVEFVNSVAILSVSQLMSSDPADSNKVAAGARTTFWHLVNSPTYCQGLYGLSSQFSMFWWSV